LIEGSSNAAVNSMKKNIPDLAILISCVGRKLVLDQRIEEEVEVVRAVYGDGTAITGFYSYGEIAPTFNFSKCELHNQTMTITTFTED
ncbi:MAG: FIST C-terminal domain-containing protein, partial [Bacteroidota bacterium]